jgi:cell division protein FtsZ
VSKHGFDPERLEPPKREEAIIPQILAPETSAVAKGFTEIKVVGLGGSGSNTVDRMIQSGVQGIDFIAVNTDAQALEHTLARKRVPIGDRLTRGLGTGGDPRLGDRGAENATDALREALSGADMVFITAGLGGGTGTGAAPVVAEIARNMRALTVGVVTLPFSFEGSRRRAIAQEGLKELRPLVDSLIVVSNDRLLEVASANVGITESFKLADQMLHRGIHGIADLVLTPGLINLDFADVRSVMENSGTALMGFGSGSGENRAVQAAEAALTSPLLETSMKGAAGILMNITGGPDLTLYEVNEAAARVAAIAGPDCNTIFGAVIHPKLRDEVRLTVIATGFNKRG